MNAEQLKAMLRSCVDEARQDEPTNTDARAHCFIAKLSGALARHDAALSDEIFSVLESGRGAA